MGFQQPSLAALYLLGVLGEYRGTYRAPGTRGASGEMPVLKLV